MLGDVASLVAELIPADLKMFDVVTFDEAYQIPPEEAICSLAHAPQAIIAGDHLQLPPTDFSGAATLMMAMLRNIRTLRHLPRARSPFWTWRARGLSETLCLHGTIVVGTLG